ncbi:NAD(P)/FAD-dependent oxidoreductase [Streptomyces sp. NPDC057654]|uniref:NAD(P)/FAD-dependent oxidoreductase n=1 Tax=Streptomyces sp. NPDC057654 TaxID=3346196 RepID=UPI00367E1BC7
MNAGHPDPVSPRAGGGHAVVIGAGIAGLLAAQALSGSFGQVTLIERDRLDAAPTPRKGVPQGRHAHALQARGLQCFEELLPGIQRELSAAGATPVDFCREARLHFPPGSPRPMESGIRIQPVSRPLLESVLREHVLRTHGTNLRDACAVTGLTANATGRRITGVRLRPRSRGTHDGTRDTGFQADLVVDASGRSSHLPRWLADLGLPRVTETSVDAHVGYASRVYRVTSRIEWSAVFELLHPPTTARGAFALRIEGDRLIVTLQGAAGDHPPTDEQGFDAFMKTLSSDVYEAVQQLRPAGTPVRYARTANRRLDYHRLNPWPDGLIALGDAVCAFNPVYAQGMTVAALEALALRDHLARHPDPRQPGACAKFQRRLRRITAAPWALATLPDHAWQSRQPPLVSRIALWYLGRWHQLIPNDPRMHRDIARVTNMLAPPLLLLHPRHLARVAASVIRPRQRARAADWGPTARADAASGQRVGHPHPESDTPADHPSPTDPTA